jgi:multiple sugar transport system substrate-binding protein/sn-glycerol 3-phosphate transport system substrate-binding protein
LGETARALDELVELYNLTNELGIQVEASASGSLENLDDQVRQALQDGQPPDLVAAYLFQALDWEAERPLVDLEAYIQDTQWGLTPDEQADFYPAWWDAGLAGEKRLGLPVLGGGQVLYYNQSWARELGFTQPPATPDQLREQACAAAQAKLQDDAPDNDGAGGLILSTHYSPMLGWLAGFGAQVFDRSAKGDPYDFDNPEVQQTFTFLRSLYDQGCAWLPEEPYPEEAFAGRDGLFAMGSVANLPYQSQAIQRRASGDTWTVLPFPAPDGQPAIGVYGPALEIFSSTPEEQLAAWVFARWLLLPENHARLVQAATGLPVRKSALPALQEFQASQTQWAAAQALSEVARHEPTEPSWKTVRWALGDAAAQLFRSYFTIDQVPSLVKFLDKTAAELHANPPQSDE